jgi:hypothetical protein
MSSGFSGYRVLRPPRWHTQYVSTRSAQAHRARGRPNGWQPDVQVFIVASSWSFSGSLDTKAITRPASSSEGAAFLHPFLDTVGTRADGAARASVMQVPTETPLACAL